VGGFILLFRETLLDVLAEIFSDEVAFVLRSFDSSTIRLVVPQVDPPFAFVVVKEFIFFKSLD
jgi:hypothetical protein